MRSQVVGLRVAGIVFGLMAVAQVVRLLIRPDVLVNGHHLPLWPSALALVILSGLCVWLLKLSGGSTRAAAATH
jgi:hypothetical protein